MKYANGSIYEGQWRNDMCNGQGNLTVAFFPKLFNVFKLMEYFCIFNVEVMKVNYSDKSRINLGSFKT